MIACGQSDKYHYSIYQSKVREKINKGYTEVLEFSIFSYIIFDWSTNIIWNNPTMEIYSSLNNFEIYR